jgi:predicted AAA+ superfamily ATPase
MKHLQRLFNLPKSHSFFLFGARGVGKTSLLRHLLSSTSVTFLDLLLPDDFERYARNPGQLSDLIAELPKDGEHWIVIDEVQKAPALLDMVHLELEAHSRSRMGVGNERPTNRVICFALTGSSARKLKRGKANLLAGRAFLRHLFPLTHHELPLEYALNSALAWGTLPAIVGASNDHQRKEMLGAYVHTYLREEILEEQLARSAPTFRRFLEIASQQNGEPINFAAIGRDVGLSTPTIQTYFEILEDTLIAHRIDPFHYSVRKRQREAPKFYIFDLGVARALSGSLRSDISPHNYGYGKSFEHFIICEVIRLSSYTRNDWRLSYLRTKDGLEIDLVIERPGLPIALVEIKSTDQIREEHLKPLRLLGADIPNSEMFCLSQESRARLVDGIRVLPWKEGLVALGLVIPPSF